MRYRARVRPLSSDRSRCAPVAKPPCELPGGDLEIRWAEDDHVLMTGPAEQVFSGTMHIAEDDETE